MTRLLVLPAWLLVCWCVLRVEYRVNVRKHGAVRRDTGPPPPEPWTDFGTEIRNF